MHDAEIVPVVFDRHYYRPDDEGNCWECGEAQPAHVRGWR